MRAVLLSRRTSPCSEHSWRRGSKWEFAKLAHQAESSVALFLHVMREQNDWAQVENLLLTF